MIDVEGQIFAQIASVLRASIPGVSVSGEFSPKPSKFPYVYVAEADNYVPSRYADTSDSERFVEIMYEISIYSNKTKGAKAECRKILAVADEWMYKHNFVRDTAAFLPNMQNATIRRMQARYRAVTDGNRIYRR